MRVKHSQKIIMQDCKNITSDLRNIKRHLTGAQKIIAFSSIIITLSLLNIIHASALTYQSTADLKFTFNPVIAVNVSGDLIIPNLAPNTSADSNIITVSASSNSPSGYILYATVGDSSNASTNLTHTNGTNTFTSIATATTLAGFGDNKWGYAYSTDSGSSWFSGNVDNPSNTDYYSGLPLYTNTGIKLAETSNATGTSIIQFKIGAKASSTQVSGTYTNTINFIGVGNVITTNYTLSYVDNSNEATDMPSSNTTGTTTDGTFTISTAKPSRTDYKFTGWCTVDNSSDDSTCSGTIIQPGGLYSIGSTASSFTGAVYAMWEDAVITPAGETWYFNETLTFGQISYYVDFTNNSEEYSEIRAYSEAGGFIAYYIRGNGTASPAVFNSTWYADGDCAAKANWCNESYRTITITGGDDYDNANFRTWLSDNATQL